MLSAPAESCTSIKQAVRRNFVELAMSVTDAPITGPAFKAAGPTRTGNSLLRFLGLLWKTMFNEPYRPERHYMRGPGPAYARKHSLVR
jgi:hypothetical protein